MAKDIPNVIVLMSTYNGSRFLQEQLDSLFAQKGVVPMLVVRDDGSTDNTIDILEKYCQSYPNQITIIKGTNIGWRKSFFELVCHAAKTYPDEKYFAFSDQDDIWLPEKLARAVAKIEGLKNAPNLYCSNLFYYKNGINHGKIRSGFPVPTPKSCLVRNYATGCTMVFNDRLLKLAASNIPEIQVAHDFWVYQLGVLCGNVVMDNESYILYRQHENNQIGSKSGWKDVWKRRIRDFRKSLSEHQRENQARELQRYFSDEFSETVGDAVSKVVNYRKNPISKMKLILDDGYTTGRRSNDFWLKLRILFSAY